MYDDWSVSAYTESLKINQNHFAHLLNHGHLESATDLLNIIVHCKALCKCESSETSDACIKSQKFFLELAISSLQQYLSTLLQNNLPDQSKLNLINFFIELELLKFAKEARRYSTSMITTAFLWQLTSCSLHKKLRDLFILPSLSRLQAYSSCLSVNTGTLDISYLKQRTEELNEKECLVTLMIDEVYTAKRIEYANGSFVGLTKSREPAKTVLAFMVQSSCSKFKDVVCLVPVNTAGAK